MDRQFFAQLDENNIVTDVNVVTAQFMAENPERYPGRWVETFLNNPDKIYAGIGFEYLEDEQNFRWPSPYPSWIWSNGEWQPPKPMPSTGGPYRWSEEDLEWVAI